VKRFFFAVAVVALSACAGLAEDPPTAPAPTPATPIVQGSGPSYGYVPVQSSQPARRGLFSRLRNRNNTTYYNSGTTVPMMMTTPSATPMPPPAPMPMPGVRPAGGAVMPGQILQATGNLPPGIYTTTDGTVVQIGGTQMATPMTTPMTMPVTSSTTTQPTRRGLFGRLRY
jgi:hypothetical protein